MRPWHPRLRPVTRTCSSSTISSVTPASTCWTGCCRSWSAGCAPTSVKASAGYARARTRRRARRPSQGRGAPIRGAL